MFTFRLQRPEGTRQLVRLMKPYKYHVCASEKLYIVFSSHCICKQIYYKARKCNIAEVEIFEINGSIETLGVSITMMNHRHIR